jgi:hypothetical protein
MNIYVDEAGLFVPPKTGHRYSLVLAGDSLIPEVTSVFSLRILSPVAFVARTTGISNCPDGERLQNS